MVLIYPISGINKRETSAKRSLPGESYGSFIAVGHRVRSRFTNFEYEKIRKRAGGGAGVADSRASQLPNQSIVTLPM